MISLAVVGIVCSVGYQGYLETRIFTPYDGEKIVPKLNVDKMSRFWGSYRPGVYFGMKHRSPKSLIAGLLWLLPSQIKQDVPLRHLCQQSDNLKKYGWIQHDGINFGVQEIFDGNFKITTSFVKRAGGNYGGDWTARITFEPLRSNNLHSRGSNMNEAIIYFYFGKEIGADEDLLSPDIHQNFLTGLHGSSSELGQYSVRFINGNGVLHGTYLASRISSMNDINNAILTKMEAVKKDGNVFYGFQKSKTNNEDSNLYVHQVHINGSFTMEIVFESDDNFGRETVLAGEEYTKALTEFSVEFESKFESTFGVRKRGFNESWSSVSKACLSNILGGIGYFWGTSRVLSPFNKEPVFYWAAPLYTAVPSRSFFPRGFLWDEGFHLLLLNTWSPSISIDIIAHWLDLMNVEGWIPREQILGEEAVVRVPSEFIVQKNDVANPPTLLIALADLLKRHKALLVREHKETLLRMWPRLTLWYNWLNRTQSGELPFSYRWRGRNESSEIELNPKTLASGLDDYPRASHPSSSERHVDLRCWMSLASRSMSTLATLLSLDATKYSASATALSDLTLLNSLHWAPELGTYADWGLHSSRVEPQYGYVDSFGYVSLFPMLLEILDPEAPELAILLQKLGDTNLLWTPYGLRSLSGTAPLYDKHNTAHDGPYWRGAIWINMNFLALKSLKSYGSSSSASAPLALSLYKRLRENVMGTVVKEYLRTGYVWEQYSDRTGEGKGCRPFTGWSALVVLIMSEDY